MATRIKVCGITNEEDALAAVEAGVDVLGFVFASSPRRITLETAGRIIGFLPPVIATVGVFVDEKVETVREIFNQCRLDIVQLHGQESRTYADSLGVPVLKAFHVNGQEVLSQIKHFGCPQFLLDTFDRDLPGGTGKTSDWQIARQAGTLGDVILAGGLNHINIVDALAQVRPFGVDVSSGVEKHPRKKDPAKLRRFVHEVRKWDYQTTKGISASTAAGLFPKR